MNNKIDVRQFNFFYGASQALIDLNLPVRENQITALIGPSGCGKSTFLRSLNRMNDTIRGTRATGEVLLDGKNVYDPDVDVVEVEVRYQAPLLTRMIVEVLGGTGSVEISSTATMVKEG